MNKYDGNIKKEEPLKLVDMSLEDLMHKSSPKKSKWQKFLTASGSMAVASGVFLSFVACVPTETTPSDNNTDDEQTPDNNQPDDNKNPDDITNPDDNKDPDDNNPDNNDPDDNKDPDDSNPDDNKDPEESKIIKIDYQEYMEGVLAEHQAADKNFVYNKPSTWSVDLQDALKQYLDTNYGEQFMTGDRVLDSVEEKNKEIVGYDFDLENNKITALIQTVSKYDKNEITYITKSLEMEETELSYVLAEYLTNNDIKQKCGDLSNSYEDDEGNTIVFVNNGQAVDFSSTATLDGKYKSSSIFASIILNQSFNYPPSEYGAVKPVYNFIFQGEQYEQIDKLLFATEGSTYGTTKVLGKEGYTFSSTMLYYNTNGQLTTTRFDVETPSTGAKKFVDIPKDGIYMQDYAIRSNVTATFGSGNSIVRVDCLEKEKEIVSQNQ